MNEFNNVNQMPTSTGVGFNNVENAIPSQAMTSGMVFQEQPKPYTLRKLKATELFPMLNILKKIGFKKFTELLQSGDASNILGKLKSGEKITDGDLINVGSFVFDILGVILDGATNCENEFFTILSNVSGLTVTEIKELDLDVLVAMVIELVKDNMGFIKDVSKFLK